MIKKYVCENNPEHVFDNLTSDYWCSICPVEKRSMLLLKTIDESVKEEPVSFKTDVISPPIINIQPANYEVMHRYNFKLQ
ncbi:MAG: hypothetical protein ACKO7P_01450 [Bacteroidota bacterium]